MSDNFFSFGHFDQCIESNFIDSEGDGAADTVLAKYCSIGVFRNETFMQLGVCVPESCSPEAMLNFLKPALIYMDLELNQIDYCTTRRPRQWGILQISTFILIGSIILLCTMATLQNHLLLLKHGKQIYLILYFHNNSSNNTHNKNRG